MHPPGHAITSINSASAVPFLTISITFLAFPSPLVTKILISFPFTLTVALFIPFSPRTSSNFISSKSFPVNKSWAVLRAASITPPVVPKIAPAPVASPIGLSNSESLKSSKSILACLIIFASSLVVITASTLYKSSFFISGLCLSNFLATHGITDTTYIFFASILFFSA